MLHDISKTWDISLQTFSYIYHCNRLFLYTALLIHQDCILDYVSSATYIHVLVMFGVTKHINDLHHSAITWCHSHHHNKTKHCYGGGNVFCNLYFRPQNTYFNVQNISDNLSNSEVKRKANGLGLNLRLCKPKLSRLSRSDYLLSVYNPLSLAEIVPPPRNY